MSGGLFITDRAHQRRDCLGPFQDAVVAETIDRIEGVLQEVAASRGVDELDLRTWLAWAVVRKEVE